MQPCWRWRSPRARRRRRSNHWPATSAPRLRHPRRAATFPPRSSRRWRVPKPRSTPKTETYSVVVNNVQVKDLLFALARDAKVNVDIHPGITGVVSLNAINQTLPQLLTRISKQVDMRFELDGPNLAVMPDSPFLKHYKVDYVNMARNVTGTVSTNTQIATSVPAQAGGSGGGTPVAAGGHTSPTPRSTTLRKTCSGNSSKRTSRTSCTKPTRSSPRVRAKPSSSRPIHRPRPAPPPCRKAAASARHRPSPTPCRPTRRPARRARPPATRSSAAAPSAKPPRSS